MTPRPHPSRLGEIVGGKYKVVRLLAAGGMGAVYEAQHTVVKRRFAIKFLHPDLAARRDILTRFQREAEAAGALESENVAAAVDFGIVPDGTPYIVMELLAGESLESLIAREKTLPVTRAADLVAQACRGVQAAHAAGIVHRDLKPQNLFVCRRQDGTDLVKVLDFGVAKLQAINEGSGQTGTGTGAVLGTPSYMSPEQARGASVVDHRADVYALGAILYQLVSGQKPHPGDSNNAILYHISTQPPVPLATVKPELAPALVEIVERALAPDPDARPASAEALGAALAPVAGREVWPEAKPAPAIDATPIDTSPAGAPRAPKRAGVVAAATFVVVVALVAVARFGRTPAPEAAPPAPVATQPSPPPPAATTRNDTPPIPPAPETPPAPPVQAAGAPAAAAVRAGTRTRERAIPTRAADAPPPAKSPPSPAVPSTTAGPAADSRPEPVTFDQQNPYN
jgi:serine/threonine-protein kinase